MIKGSSWTITTPPKTKTEEDESGTVIHIDNSKIRISFLVNM